VQLGQHTVNDEEGAQDSHALACNFVNYSPILTFPPGKLSNKLFLIWLLTTPPHLKYVAALPCNLSLIACFLTCTFFVKVLVTTTFLLENMRNIHQLKNSLADSAINIYSFGY